MHPVMKLFFRCFRETPLGGSYPGFLSAMMRFLHPGVVDIGYASSAPLPLYVPRPSDTETTRWPGWLLCTPIRMIRLDRRRESCHEIAACSRPGGNNKNTKMKMKKMMMMQMKTQRRNAELATGSSTAAATTTNEVQ
mmetsp:Transcript_16277/g.23639  ORF Transcript_16277/g.23639 Transcript_16277/m.23639 type:complete len:137 (+) Transcript_16277:745-1155(+)